MVSDGLSMMNAQMSSTSFKLGKVKIGDRNYLGNNIHFPAGGKTGTDLPARHQGDDPDRWPGARRCRPARLALLRDPACGRARPEFQHGARRGGPPAAAAQEERAQHRHRGGVPAGQLGVHLRHAVRDPRRRAALSAPRPRLAVRRRRIPVPGVDPVLRAARACEPRLQAAAAAGRVDLRRLLLVPRAALEVLRVRRCSRCSRARPSRT